MRRATTIATQHGGRAGGIPRDSLTATHDSEQRADRIGYHRTPEFQLECGEILRDVIQAYHLDGELNASRDNVVLVFHALTGSADAAGDWWRGIIGRGKAIDTGRWAVLAPNLLGSCYGTTGPSDPARRPFPRVTTRDAARLVHHLVEALDIRGIELAVGGSLGGMVTLEWVASFPTLTRSAVAFAAPAAHTAAGIGWNHIQRHIIRAAGDDGLEIARMVAMMTYRTPAEFEQRFSRQPRDDGYEIESYLSHHGRKLQGRFDRHSYLTLLEMMDSHDVGRGRGGVGAALMASSARITGVGIPGDVLYPADDVERWTDAAGAEYATIESLHGHDAFLIEHEQVSAVLRRALGGSHTEDPEPLMI